MTNDSRDTTNWQVVITFHSIIDKPRLNRLNSLINDHDLQYLLLS